MTRPISGPAVAIGLAVATLFIGGPLRAQQPEPTPSHILAARDLIQATGTLGSLDEMLPALVEDIKKQAVTRPEMIKDLNEVLASLQPELELQRQQALNTAAVIYAKWLTEPEMREVVAFYKTPTGAKYARVQPELVDDVVSGMTNWSQQAAEYVMVRTRVEMSKRGHQMQ